MLGLGLFFCFAINAIFLIYKYLQRFYDSHPFKFKGIHIDS